MRIADIDTQVCSVARAVAIVGDSWTLMVMREVFMGTRRFEHFQRNIGLSRHRLADRLGKLVEHNVLEKRAYQDKPQRFEYRLTAKGKALHPVILTLAQWGNDWLSDADGPPLAYRHNPCNHNTRASLHCDHCGEHLSPHDISPIADNGIQHKLQRGEALPGVAKKMLKSHSHAE